MAEQSLKESKEKFEALIENSTDVISVIDKDGKSLFRSPSFEKTLGYNQENKRERDAFAYIIEEDKIRIFQQFELAKNNYGSIEKINFRAYHKNGSVRCMEGTAKNMLHSPNIKGIIVNYRDITESKEVQQALKDSEERLNTIIDNASDAIVIYDLKGKIIIANKTVCERLGYTHEEFMQLKLQNIYSPEYASKISERIEKLLNLGSIVFETVHVSKTGKEISVEISARVIDFAGQKLIISIGRDLTERKKMKNTLQQQNKQLAIAKEKAEESNRLKSAFLANMSHEIRTPMNAILGFASFLKNDTLESERRNQFVDIINNSGNHLLNLINDIVDISKIDAGQMTIIETEFKLNDFLFELYQFFYSNISQKSKKLEITLIKEFQDDNDIIKTDKTRLRQILINIIGNAVKFTDYGSVEIEYLVTDDNMIQFSVKDTGIGISKEEIPIIFKRFRQADETSTRKYGGTGLGLAISKACAELLDGKIWVESELGFGSTFYFTIPYKPVFENTIRTPVNIESIKNIFVNKTILIVEDEPYSCLILEEILKPTKANILKANDGEQAINFCKNNLEIDLVLMDIQLPKIDGLTATNEIKKNRPNLPIISQTANAMQNDFDKSIEAGCDDYLTKPINRKELITKIAKQIKNTALNLQ